ncbi:coiled-coil-helix-coiled-coil-helix domain containing 3b isoform X4 [Danio rerio]|uniref:Coiled-coil-helix-coiled-coil-helix domain containing 3b isoform X4 n=1 Tax=Danio rerio TaxID=7955 RepID=A0AC58IUJ6_DANRE|nr:uncharacterized protein LOC325751 isoform X2 [Danio rerio]|eukprot:XP_017209544.1 uncharacterized protein LOC325751 isoform X2 [Danio rerio]
MGGNSSSRHVSLDDEEGVTFVKGIRLSERVIDRMKESPHVQTSTKTSTQSENTKRSVPDERQVPIMPHPPSYASALVSSEPPASSVPVIEETSTPASPVGHTTVEEPVVPSISGQVFPSQAHVDEEKLRKEIREDLLKQMSEEMKTAELNIRQQLDKEKAKALSQAQATARRQIEEEVKKLLEEEKTSQQQTLADAIRREQLSVQDERLITQYYWMERKAQKLEEKEKDLKNQDDLFRQQIAKMEEKMSKFTKVTSENYKKGLEDAQNRFRRYRIKPVCSDLQSQILKCYAENKGQTMCCSNIASLYIQCVDRARQDEKLSTGG